MNDEEPDDEKFKEPPLVFVSKKKKGKTNNWKKGLETIARKKILLHANSGPSQHVRYRYYKRNGIMP